MIVFDLACADRGHVFEAWFGSTEDFVSQRERGLVECPICGDRQVEKAVMAPRISAKGNRTAGRPGAASSVTAPSGPQTPPSPPPSPEAVKALLGRMAEAQRQILAESDYVGHRFADEARAIHHGESGQRSIHGIASPSEARSLIEDGIGVAPLPFPVRPPQTEN